MFTHEDLAANAGTNPGETARNGVDDDGNGYVVRCPACTLAAHLHATLALCGHSQLAAQRRWHGCARVQGSGQALLGTVVQPCIIAGAFDSCLDTNAGRCVRLGFCFQRQLCV